MAILFEDDEQEITPSSQKSSEPDTGLSLSDIFKQMLGKATGTALSKLGGDVSQKVIPGEFSKGYGEGVPEALYTGSRGLSELTGNDVSEIEFKKPGSIQQSIGRALGKGIGYSALAGPIIAGAEGLLPAGLPEMAASLGSAGLAGSALTPGGIKERGLGALEFMAPTAIIKALQPLGGIGLKGIKSLITPPQTKPYYQKIVDAYDQSKAKLDDIFNFVSKEADQRNIKNIGELPDEIFEEATKFGPKVKSFKLILDKAKSGDYDSIRRMYSKFGDIERKSLKSQDWEKADIFGELKDMINEGLSEHFSNSGNKDLSTWLDAARHGYSNLKRTFESPYESEIRKLVGPNRDFPQTFEPLLRDRKSLETLLDAVPSLRKDMDQVRKAQEVKKLISSAYEKGKTGVGLLLANKILGSDNRSRED